MGLEQGTRRAATLAVGGPFTSCLANGTRSPSFLPKGQSDLAYLTTTLPASTKRYNPGCDFCFAALLFFPSPNSPLIHA